MNIARVASSWDSGEDGEGSDCSSVLSVSTQSSGEARCSLGFRVAAAPDAPAVAESGGRLRARWRLGKHVSLSARHSVAASFVCPASKCRCHSLREALPGRQSRL